MVKSMGAWKVAEALVTWRVPPNTKWVKLVLGFGVAAALRATEIEALGQ